MRLQTTYFNRARAVPCCPGTAFGLILVQILFRNVVFRNLPGSYLALVSIGSILYSAHGLGFHVLAFFHQFFHAFRIVVASA